ncbi:hypothetical protein acdb102_16800 [Acidothermaceae bacterium B102]|nr:hypothetical protein acdb102_16800 [Acidothermaceae bacterium B102]
MPGAHGTTGRLKTHWTNTALTVTLAAAATAIGVHLAVVAPATSPVTPPLALAAYSTTAVTVATEAPAQPSAAEHRGRHDGGDRG